MTVILPYLTIAGMLALVLFPLIVPALITLVHTVTDPGSRAARCLRRTRSQGLAVPEAG